MHDLLEQRRHIEELSITMEQALPTSEQLGKVADVDEVIESPSSFPQTSSQVRFSLCVCVELLCACGLLYIDTCFHGMCVIPGPNF